MANDSVRDKEKTIRVLGLDPSTSNLGISVIDVDITKPTKFKLIHVVTLNGVRLNYDIPNQFDDNNNTGINARSYALAKGLGTLIDVLDPDTGICEDNFLGVNPLTFKQLIQVVAMLRESFTSRNKHMSYVLPNLAKAIVNANFKGSQKEDVKDGVIAYDWLDDNGFDLSLCDEHSIDAIAVTLFRCEQIALDYGVERCREMNSMKS